MNGWEVYIIPLVCCLSPDFSSFCCEWHCCHPAGLGDTVARHSGASRPQRLLCACNAIGLIDDEQDVAVYCIGHPLCGCRDTEHTVSVPLSTTFLSTNGMCASRPPPSVPNTGARRVWWVRSRRKRDRRRRKAGARLGWTSDGWWKRWTARGTSFRQETASGLSTYSCLG